MGPPSALEIPTLDVSPFMRWREANPTGEEYGADVEAVVAGWRVARAAAQNWRGAVFMAFLGARRAEARRVASSFPRRNR